MCIFQWQRIVHRNLAFIKPAVRESDAEKIVVVTHHLPTFAVSKIDIKEVF